MNFLGVYVSSFVLSAFLPLSVLVLYVVLSRHIPLAPKSLVDEAVIQMFDSQAERLTFDADVAARWHARRVRVLARYRQRLLAHLEAMDPVQAAPYLARAARIGEVADDDHDTGDGDGDAAADAGVGPVHSRDGADLPARHVRIARVLARRPKFRLSAPSHRHDA